MNIIIIIKILIIAALSTACSTATMWITLPEPCKQSTSRREKAWEVSTCLCWTAKVCRLLLTHWWDQTPCVPTHGNKEMHGYEAKKVSPYMLCLTQPQNKFNFPPSFQLKKAERCESTIIAWKVDFKHLMLMLFPLHRQNKGKLFSMTQMTK